MIKDFNLVVSTYRNREGDCISELWYFLHEEIEGKIIAQRTGLPGLVVAKVDANPFEVVDFFREITEENPWDLRFILKIVPIEATVETSLENIRKCALELAKRKIGPEDTFKVDPNIRLSLIHRHEIIEAIAPHIENKVDLDNPSKIIRVEVIGEVTGISVLKPEYILSIAKIKRLKRFSDRF